MRGGLQQAPASAMMGVIIIMARKEFTTIPIERTLLDRLQAVKEELQLRAERPLRWADVFTALLAFKDQADVPEDSLMAHMAREDERALTPEELEAMGVVQFSGLPLALSDEDRDRIAQLVVDKLVERLPGLLGGSESGRTQE